jgi:hypothetical protein
MVSKRLLLSEGSAAFVKMAHTGRNRHRPGRYLHTRRHIMNSHAIETGWQRFLDRLKQLWGKLGQGGKTPAAAG